MTRGTDRVAAVLSRRGTLRGGNMLLVVLLLSLPWVLGSDYLNTALQDWMIFAILATALNLLLGFGGYLSAAHGAIFGVGMYAVAILNGQHGWNTWPALVVAILAAAVVGAVLGVLTLRLSGHYFAVATAVFALGMETLFVSWTSLTGGPIGIPFVPRPSAIGPFSFESGKSMSVLLILVFLLCLGFCYRVVRSGFGRALTATRDNSRLAEALGIHLARHRVVTFTVSSGLAGLAGGLYGTWSSFVLPSNAGVLVGFRAILFAVVGGMFSIWGPAIGAFVGIFLPEWLRAADQWQLLIFGVVVTVAAIRFSRGLVGLVEQAWRALVRSAGAGGRRGAVAADAPANANPDDDAGAAAASAGVERAPLGEVVLSATGVGVSYGGVHALRDVGLTLRTGELLAVIGPNGAGKSTLFDVLAGRTRTEGGRILLRGDDVTRVPAHTRAARGLQRTFQHTQLFVGQTVRQHLEVSSGAIENQRLWRSVAGRLRPELPADIDQITELADLTAWWDTPSDHLPLDVQKRLAIAMAMTRRPIVLLLDEPFAGLGRDGEVSVHAMISRLRALPLGICLVEHNMPVVMSLADRVMVLDHGELLAEGTPQEVRTDERVIEAYLGSSARTRERAL